jgi:hypothetical protein
LIVGARRAVEPALDARHAALADHERIYEAIAARNTEGARTAMRDHLTDAIEFIRELGGLPQDGHRPPPTDPPAVPQKRRAPKSSPRRTPDAEAAPVDRRRSSPRGSL